MKWTKRQDWAAFLHDDAGSQAAVGLPAVAATSRLAAAVLERRKGALAQWRAHPAEQRDDLLDWMRAEAATVAPSDVEWAFGCREATDWLAVAGSPW